MDSLKDKTRKGIYWSAANNIANIGIQFIFSIILARLLSPDAYGVIGLLSVFIAVVSVFVDCGFSQSLIRKQDRTQTDFSTEFYFNIVVGIVAYLILFCIAPYIALFYEMPILDSILKIIGLGVFINSLCVVQSSQFSIRLDFKTPAKISVATQVSTGVIGIVMAYYGWGVWALVFQQLAGNILRAILLWILAGWRPTLEFSMLSFKYQWNFGSKLLATSLMQQLYDNMYPLIIGKFFSSQTLGLFSRAQSFANLPSSNISFVLGKVTFPIMSKINNDLPRLLNIYRRMVKSTVLIVFPMMLLLAALADPIIKFLFNEQWYDCILMLQIICLALLWHPISFISLGLLSTTGRTDVILKIEVIKRVAGILSLVFSVPFGIIGICVGYVILYLFCFIVNTYATSKTLHFSLKELLLDVIPILVNSIFVALLVYLVSSAFSNPLVSLCIGGLIGAICLLGTTICFFRTTLEDTISILKNSK